MAHPLRNEVRVELSGRTYMMRPTFGCLAAIEDETDRGVLEIANDFTKGQLRVKEIFTILREGLHAGGEKLTKAEIEALIEDNGLTTIVNKLGAFFGVAFYGGERIDQEVESSSDPDDKKND